MIKKEAIAIIISLLIYSIIAFAYVHKTFVDRDIFKLVLERLDRIETKIDKIIGGN